MSATCAVVNCHNRAGRDKRSYYRLPRVIKHQGEETERKSETRRRLWMAAINRSDMDQKNCDYLRVCSDHFITGKPADLYSTTDPDWVPSKQMGYDAAKSPTKTALRFNRLQKRKEQRTVTEAAMSLLDLSASLVSGASATSEDQEETPDSPAENTELSDAEKLALANLEIADLKAENLKLQEQNECLKNIVHKMKANLPDDFKNDDDKVKYYTGLPGFVTLMALFNLLSPEISENKNSSLCKFQKFIITLMRLRLNLPIVDLSYRFGVSKTTISKAFLDTVHVMFEVLQPLVRWPEREELHETMPMVFRKYFGRRITVIIDCFEIFIDRPSNMMARAQTWSNYKHHNTAKYLIGVTPQGSVSFISEGWGGRVSDKHLTANCNFLRHLVHGDVVLADRGFDITELVAFVGAEVKFPAFMRGKLEKFSIWWMVAVWK